MLSHCGLVKVLRIEPYAQGTIRLLWIGERKYLFGRLVDIGYHPFVNYVTKGVLNLVPGT